MDQLLHTSGLSPDEMVLLQSWEEIYMRGHFTFWVLFAVHSGSENARSITQFIKTKNQSIHVNEQSLYRALRRYDDAGLIDVAHGITKKHKKYHLSATGERVLAAFIARHITPLQQLSQ